MRCPYLLSKLERICVQMVEAGLPGEISDSDYERYCDGNPFYCYYFRNANQKTEALKKQKERIQKQLVLQPPIVHICE